MQSNRFRPVSVLLVTTLIAVAGYSILAPKADAVNGFMVGFQSKEERGGSTNLGIISFSSTLRFSLPRAPSLVGGSGVVEYFPALGYEFVRWESTGIDTSTTVTFDGKAGVVSGSITFDDPKSARTTANIQGDGVIIAVYQRGRGYVGGVVGPTNTYITLAPYLAVIGLVAVAATVAVKKRRN